MKISFSGIDYVSYLKVDCETKRVLFVKLSPEYVTENVIK